MGGLGFGIRSSAVFLSLGEAQASGPAGLGAAGQLPRPRAYPHSLVAQAGGGGLSSGSRAAPQLLPHFCT